MYAPQNIQKRCIFSKNIKENCPTHPLIRIFDRNSKKIRLDRLLQIFTVCIYLSKKYNVILDTSLRKP